MQTNTAPKLIKHPLPMQYLGSKLRIATWILNEIEKEFGKRDRFIDLMSGTGAVAHEANLRGYKIVANDIQPYSFIVLRSVFLEGKEGLDVLIDTLKTGLDTDVDLLKGREGLAEKLNIEEKFKASLHEGHFDWEKYKQFCQTTHSEYQSSRKRFDLFSTYYPNTYFGVRQCLELDALQEIAANLPENLKVHLVAATISSMTHLVSSTTHLAQYLKPTSLATAKHLLERRTKSLIEAVVQRLENLQNYPTPKGSKVFNTDYREVLKSLETNHSVVYADPPYFKEHYSRYYHVLDTFALYDFPELSFNDRINDVTVGRYRSERIVSDFGLKSKVEKAFRELFELSALKKMDVALSYASTSLLKAEHIKALAKEFGYSCKLKETTLLHSGQGQAARNKKVTEFLFLFKYGSQS